MNSINPFRAAEVQVNVHGLAGMYQNVSNLDFIGATDDGGRGDNWSYKTCKTPVKSSPPTKHNTQFLTGRQNAFPVAQPTVLEH